MTRPAYRTSTSNAAPKLACAEIRGERLGECRKSSGTSSTRTHRHTQGGWFHTAAEKHFRKDGNRLPQNEIRRSVSRGSGLEHDRVMQTKSKAMSRARPRFACFQGHCEQERRRCHLVVCPSAPRLHRPPSDSDRFRRQLLFRPVGRVVRIQVPRLRTDRREERRPVSQVASVLPEVPAGPQTVRRVSTTVYV
jgi:hypothetical protein